MDGNEGFVAACDASIPDEPQIPATLFQDGEVIATGVAILDTSTSSGLFWPRDGKQLNIPGNDITLKLSDRLNAIRLIDFQWCSIAIHYHFRTENARGS